MDVSNTFISLSKSMGIGTTEDVMTPIKHFINIDVLESININGSLVANGDLIAASFTSISDKRVKYDIETYNKEKALQQIEELRVTTYKKIDDNEHKINIGFIAQEVDKIIPECINKSDRYLPNIYNWVECISFIENELIIKNTCNLYFKQRIKIIDEKMHPFTVTVIDTENGNAVLILDGTEYMPYIITKVLIYGTKINDFHSVKYDYIFSLAVSSIQLLSEKVKQQEKEIALLRDKVVQKESTQVSTQASTQASTQGCQTVLKSGKNKGEKCGKVACSKHISKSK